MLFIVLLLTACTPRELPPQLAFTPGPAYSLTDRSLVTGAYSVETPDGWRVIAGPAENPYTFQFVAPDNTALIVLSNREITDPPRPLNADASTLEVQEAVVRGGDVPLYAALVAPESEIDELRPVLDALIGSIR